MNDSPLLAPLPASLPDAVVRWLRDAGVVTAPQLWSLLERELDDQPSTDGVTALLGPDATATLRAELAAQLGPVAVATFTAAESVSWTDRTAAGVPGPPPWRSRRDEEDDR